ncbi:MAG TPA: error-prone DNA polymerase [Rhizomicrobium sp.]|jgi:error-prone DNA polymerase|nr:error-prone DNA polymerase [Rhizomicrobium sp.]
MSAALPYAEIAITTNFSFLRGASHPRELVLAATLYGHAAIGIADRNTLAGVVRAYEAVQEVLEKCGTAPKLLVGTRLVFADGTPDILAYPTNRAAYGRLCRLLSQGKLRAAKGECIFRFEDLFAWQDGMLFVVLPPNPSRAESVGAPFKRAWNNDATVSSPARSVGEGDREAVEGARNARRIQRPPPVLRTTSPTLRAGEENRRAGEENETITVLRQLSAAAPDRVWLGASMPYQGDDRRRLKKLERIARDANVKLIATNDVLYHAAERRALQDIVTCIREHKTLDEAGRLLEPNAERHLKTPQEMAALFRDAPEAIAETIRFADTIEFSLDQIRYNYPDEPVPKGKTAQQHLEDLTWAGAARKYPQGIPTKLRATLEKELALIAELAIAPYFLTVHDIVGFAKSRDILCQGRGSAANSAVCYVLGITAVDPMAIDLLFERFVSQERREPPDIDVDFEHERREDVIQDIYARYGRHRAALTATVICYRPRSAIREVGKVFGLTEDVTAALASGVWGSWGASLKESEVREGRLDPENSLIARAVAAANELIGFPRHLSQHVGGFVLTRDRLDEIVPVGPATMENRWFIEWDKDDIDTLRMMKVDVLGLGMLSCVRKAFELIAAHEYRHLSLPTVPREDPAVYDMLCKADAIGVFQVESRAQMNMLPRLKPREFYDLVIEVAIVRPGPIQGDMVHPYLRRRNGSEPVEFPSPSLEHGAPDELRSVLGKTLGVPLFQEQAMKLAIVAAGFSPGEANGLRRAMATFRNVGTIDQFREKMIAGMTARGYAKDFAERCFKQIEGFGSYGFPESHAASFAHLVYVSAWIKRHHPAAFACALLNSQPMGFYAPAEIVRDARDHDVAVHHVDVNFSLWDNTLEHKPDGTLALRLGLRQIDGFHEEWSNVLIAQRGNGYRDVDSLARRARLPKRALIILAEADSFQSLGEDRREILWAVRRLPDDEALPLFRTQFVEEQPEEAIAPLPKMPLGEHVLADYRMLRLSLRAHLMQFLRPLFSLEGVLSCAEISAAKDGVRARCAGIVLTRQMPGDAGVVFVTLSDETDVCNVVVWPKLVETFRRAVMGGRLLLVEGKIQRSPEDVVHLVAQKIFDRTEELDRIAEEDEGTPPHRADDGLHRHPRNVRVIPRSRDFH